MHMFRALLTAAPLLALAPAAMAQTAAAPAYAPASAPAAAYVLGANDEIEVKVFGQPDMSYKTRIRADGTITAPYLGTVMAAGKTTGQLSDEMMRTFLRQKILSAPSINIEVTTFASKTVTVLGAVPTAGLYALDQPYSVAAMVAKAGGARADGANTVILTRANGQVERISLTDAATAATRLVAPGDTVFVPTAEKVYVYGEVNRGGAFPVTPGMTFRQALALAEGPTLAGSTRRIEVRRGGKPLTKPSLDDVVQPEDVLVIKEKWF
ncbi:polysaccharide biosynthesis/export family protein [Sphingomonas hankookensis]|uniref:polysaccharide biosynthesis/export family protein n=1 Tax=Sphingomonas hankookensis TaxID=563996 RepID=UPI00234EC5CE|nr:polysaccharide biosynthesis/export family protein [Sphingomonas hankookensis]WCP71926.1 polysaccharide biosynthesis/export family protein [Sphingomonas hankookensis]